MCNPFMPITCPGVIAGGAAVVTAPGQIRDSMVDQVVSGLAGAVEEAVTWMVTVLASWLLVPSTNLCPAGTAPSDWVAQCNTADGPAQQLRGYLLPITVLVLVAGLVWQGITMTITRKGEPLLQAVRGVWTAGLWGAVGIAGTHMVLKAGDSYAHWLLNEAVLKDSTQPPNEAMSAAMAAVLLPAVATAPFITLVVGMVVLLATLLQTILMVFREGSVVVLAGLLQLAAAGKVTQGTSSWLPKVLSWALTLATYKAAAATVYATSFTMMGGNGRDFIMGLAMLLLSIIALPAMAKFFQLFTGTLSSGGGNSIGMLGAGMAAGLHAASSLRAVGGSSASDHARYIDTALPRSGEHGPTGAVAAPPSTPAATVTNGHVTPAASSAATTTPASAGTTTGSGGAAAAGAATGPAAPIVIAGVAAAQAGAQAAKSAANTTSATMQEGR
ncbi:hypothetical protein ACIBMZ_26620 [Micromonospora sp. NPDC049900]|uniref:hypothetical protein n=1 Tax=Micromonospora sp. NPDC049900 TaxID=3364275 RepID=UPI0037ABC15C